MMDFDWLQDRLCAALRWQLVNPGRAGASDAPAIPHAGLRLWGIFLHLHEARSIGMAPNPISFTDILAYAQLMRETIRPWELEVIRALDRVVLEDAAKARGAPADAPAQNARPMSPALFDAVFSS